MSPVSVAATALRACSEYTEAQTIAAARVLTFDPPFGMPNAAWQKSLLPIVRLVDEAARAHVGRWIPRRSGDGPRPGAGHGDRDNRR